jgi:hypothetical protein
MPDEAPRAARLPEARTQTAEPLTQVNARGVTAPGKQQRAVSDEARDLAHTLFGTTRYGHKPTVRCGPNTVRPYEDNPQLTAARLYAQIERLARSPGRELGGRHAGHVVGKFPHERTEDALVNSYITPGNHLPLRRPDRSGRTCPWILEIHLIGRRRGFGGFYEDLLDL